MNVALLADVDLLINLILLFQKKLSIKEAIMFSLIVFFMIESYYYWKKRHNLVE